ncbi:HTH-type transcriptional regulator DmlR [Roseovarius albus]|uniref:HTH-type transcriptional regulator DmlR n=1 Tax=Roseovarius albus TaxID=1247867 RepID=A0A1X6ZJC8_9RHOB|nr:LysR family transcriptional regulator [Roseovarius albus]SLN53271.1 HTH-type transcriptional regulator DmlR [Roseovarius albus]
MNLNPNDLLIFLAVTETQSMTAAADQAGISKSAVSQALKRLEDTIGAKLLFRTTRSMSLTNAGAKLVPACQALRAAQQDIDHICKDANAGHGQSLTITAPHALCQSVLIPLLSDLARMQSLKFRLIAEDSPVDLVAHQIDLAIRVGATAPQSARISRIGTLRESIYCTATYLEQVGGAPKSLSGLSDWSHIANDWQGDPIRYQAITGETLQVSPIVRCNTVLGVTSFVEQHVGVALLPELLAAKLPTFVSVYPISETPIYALHQHGKTPPPEVRALIGKLRQALR